MGTDIRPSESTHDESKDIMSKCNNGFGKKSAKNVKLSKVAQAKTVFWMMIMISFSSIFIILYYSNVVNQYKNEHAELVQDYHEKKFNELWEFLNNQMAYEAKTNIKAASDSIEKEISDLDLDKLKRELDSGVYSCELTSIFKRNLDDLVLHGVDNGKNGAMVISNDFVIMTNSYYLYPTEADSTHLFSKIISSGYNKKLASDALDKIYQQDNSLICIEYLEHENPNHIMITEPSRQQLKNVYLKEGLDGFKNYQFLVPIYITEKGDVFGQTDIVNGERTDMNHKFIVIQEFNLYDQLYENYYDLFDDSYISNLNGMYEITKSSLYILGLAVIGFVLLVIFEFIAVYNNFIYGYMFAQHNKKNDNP